MEHNPSGQARFRRALIFVACFDIVHSYFQFGQGILMRKSSFGFNVTSLEGRNEGPEAELKITFPSRSLMDLVSIIVAVLLLLGVITRSVCPVLIWTYYTILRLGWEINTIVVFSPPGILARLTFWIFYGVIDVYMIFHLREILNELRVRPTPSERILEGEENPPAYDDIVPSCIETESEIPNRTHGSAPPYNQCS